MLNTQHPIQSNDDYKDCITAVPLISEKMLFRDNDQQVTNFLKKWT